MEIIHTCLHHIDHTIDFINKIDLLDQGQKLEEYIAKLLETIMKSSSRRSFVFKRNTTEVINAINFILGEKYDEGTEINAKRLLEAEKRAQDRIKQLKVEIQNGSLFQALFRNNGSKSFIISKADHEEFIDENDFLIHRGLPWKRRIFKAMVVFFDINDTITDIFIFDTNPSMSKYWWDDFLELQKKHTDAHNTEISLDTLDSKILNPLKKEYPVDHIVLRNSTVGYFRNKVEFDLVEFVAEIFANYHPVNDNLPINSLKAKILELPIKHDFDTRFSIEKDKITKRIINKIKLTDTIDLIFKDHIENLENTIQSFEDNEGNKGIIIRTNEGYERFLRK